jgi:hypothetical protein
MNIKFQVGEYTPKADDSIDISLGQMKANTRSQAFLRLAALAESVQAERAALDASGVELSALDAWLTLHAGRLTPPKLTPTQEAHLLRALRDVGRDHGAAALNTALRKVAGYNNAEKASMPYLRTVAASQSARSAPATQAPPQPDPGLRPAEAWRQVCSRLAATIGGNDYRTWIEPCELGAASSLSYVRLDVPDDVFADVIERRYGGVIREYWQAVTGRKPGQVAYVYA